MNAPAAPAAADRPSAPPANDGVPPTWLHTPANTTTHTAAEAPPAPHGGPVDTALLGRTSIGLLAVIAVILACAWLLKRFGYGRGGDSRRLRLVASRSVGSRERVVIIEIEDQWLVLGVTPYGIRRLHRLDARPSDEPSARPSFRQALAENLRQLGPRGPRR